MDLFNDINRDFLAAFRSIEPDDYRERVRFYDEHRKEVSQLSFADKVLIDIDYFMSLFEIGKYKRYLEGVDAVIETIIIDNIVVKGRDPYADLLFRKAASLYNEWQLEECEHVARQLHSITSDYPETRDLVFQCRLRRKRKWHQIVRAMAIGTCLIAILFSIIAHLVVDPFYAAHTHLAGTIKIQLIILTIALMVGGELLLYVKVKSETKKILSA